VQGKHIDLEILRTCYLDSNNQLSLKKNHRHRHWSFYNHKIEKSLLNENSLSHFRRRQSLGMDDSLGVRHKFVNKNLSKYYQWINNLLPEHIPNRNLLLNEPQTGDPHIYKINDAHINIQTIDFAYAAFKIYEMIETIESPLIVEIGGGYGGLIRNLKLLKPTAKFISFDLPTANLLSTYFLSREFPDSSFRLSTDILSQTEIDYFSDFTILPGWNISGLKTKSAHLSINMRSFAEMNKHTADTYIQEIERILTSDGAFYFVNRYEKYNTILYKYKFNRFWSVHCSNSHPLQPYLHELAIRKTNCQSYQLKTSLYISYYKDYFKNLPYKMYKKLLTPLKALYRKIKPKTASN